MFCNFDCASLLNKNVTHKERAAPMCGPLLMRYDGDVSFSPTMVSAEKPSLVKPSDSFRQVAQNTSISPAIPKNTHAICQIPP